MTNSELSGKVAVISGASRGIGKAIARTYVEAGAEVVIGSRKPDNIAMAADELNREFPGRVRGVVAHAGRPEDSQRLVSAAVESFGRVDVVVNNAATNPHFGPLLSAEESQWDKILEVNVKGYVWLCKAGVEQMRSQGHGGKIINMASVTGLQPGLMMGVYSVSKAAIIMLTKALAVELGPDDIQVNAIAPGFVKTHFSQALWSNPALNESLLEKTPAGRMAEPNEIAGLALYLASEASGFMTGAVLTVDGGFLLT